MPTINLGVSYEDIKDLDKFPVLPAGSHPFTIRSVSLIKTGPSSKTPGRPMLKAMLEFVDPATGSPFQMSYNAILPWVPPGETELDISGIGNFSGLLKVAGITWEGEDFELNTDEFVGVAGVAKIVQRPGRTRDESGQWVDDPNADPVNEIKGFDY